MIVIGTERTFIQGSFMSVVAQDYQLMHQMMSN